MFIRTTVICAAAVCFSGCGESAKPESAPAGTTVAPGNKVDPIEDLDDTPADPSDAACYRALKSATGAKAETYCKVNKDDRVCQWLYVGTDGKILFDQRSNEEIDKEGRSVALSCEAAAKKFPASK